MNDFHKSVFLKEAIHFLNIEKEKLYIDATLGGGGHSLAILEQGGLVLAIDTDQDSIDFVREKFKIQNSKFKIGNDIKIVRGNFKDIKKIAQENGFEKVDGILFDLGVSSFQLESHERGFSFQRNAALDMRMNKNLGVTASDLVNLLSVQVLEELFLKFGEEWQAKKIAHLIAKKRKIKAIETTGDLAEIIEEAKGHKGTVSKKTRAHANSKVFQALRIKVNDELFNLEEALPQAAHLLSNNGRLVVISFHSLEDRIVKKSFINFKNQGIGTIVTKKPVLPSFEEQRDNKRSRSAKLRVFERKIL